MVIYKSRYTKYGRIHVTGYPLQKTQPLFPESDYRIWSLLCGTSRQARPNHSWSILFLRPESPGGIYLLGCVVKHVCVRHFLHVAFFTFCLLSVIFLAERGVIVLLQHEKWCAKWGTHNTKSWSTTHCYPCYFWGRYLRLLFYCHFFEVSTSFSIIVTLLPNMVIFKLTCIIRDGVLRWSDIDI